MTCHPLHNYLCTNCKRTGLSQAEVAFLLGKNGEARVCLHERFASEPHLRTAMAYEVIYQKPALEPFPGLAAKRAAGKSINYE